MSLKHDTPNYFESKSTKRGAIDSVTDAGAVEAPRQIQSVTRALDIIEVIAGERDGIPLSALADRVNLNSSTCHHLISTLVSRGYIVHLGRSRGYALGEKMHQIVEMADSEFDPDLLLKNDLRELGARLGQSVQLAVLADTSLLTKLRFESPNPASTLEEPDELTKMTALHATATGKAILAWLPEIELVRVISANGMTQYTDKTITTLSGRVEELRLVRRRGYAIDDEELKDGVVCIGAALRDTGGAIVGSISTTGIASQMNGPDRAALAKKMTNAAVDFSKRLRAAKR